MPEKSLKMGRKDIQKQKTREKILTAALQEFTRNGIGTVSLDSIAIRADVARRTLYYHFKDKNEILQAIIDPRLQAGIHEIRQFRKLQSDLEEVGLFCLRFWQNDPGFMALFYHRSGEPVMDFSRYHNEFIKELKSLFSDISHRESLSIDSALFVRIIFYSLYPLLEVIQDKENFKEIFLSLFVHTARSL